MWFVLHTGDNEVDLLLRNNYEQNKIVTEADFEANYKVDGTILKMKGTRDTDGLKMVVLVSLHSDGKNYLHTIRIKEEQVTDDLGQESTEYTFDDR